MGSEAGTSRRARSQELVDSLEARSALEISMLSCAGMTLYSTLMPPSLQWQWLGMPLGAGVQAACGHSAGGTLKFCASVYDDDSDEDVDLPTVVYTCYGGSSG